MQQTLSNPRFWIGIVISLVALGFAIVRVDWAGALDAFQQAVYVWLLPAVAFSVGSILARAARWQVLFHPIRLPYWSMFKLLAIGYTIMTVFPLRLGDVARVFLVGRFHDVSKARAASTVVVERVLDILTVLIILVILAPFAPLPSWVTTAMWVGGAIVIVAGAIIAAGWFKRRQTKSVVIKAVRWLPERWVQRIDDAVDSIIDGFAVLSSTSAAGKAVGWTLATWLSGGLLMWSMLNAFELPSSPTVAIFVLAVSAVAMVIPSSPGFVGVYHTLVIEALVIGFDVSSGPAASFAIISHLMLFVPPVLIGVGYLVMDQGVWNAMLEWRQHRDDDDDKNRRPAEQHQMVER